MGGRNIRLRFKSDERVHRLTGQLIGSANDCGLGNALV